MSLPACEQAERVCGVACSVSQGDGDAGMASQAQDADDQVPEGGHDVRASAGPGGGAVLAEAPHDREEILYAEIDVEKARQKKIIRVPKLHEIDRIRDRRPELYGEIVRPKNH